MKKLYIIMVVLLTCAFAVIGCGTPATTTPTKPTTPVASTTAPATVVPTKPATSVPSSKTSPTTTAKPTASPALTPQYGGILRAIDAAAPGTPIGWLYEAAGGALRTTAVCLDLLIHEDHNGNFKPNLAESYEVDATPDKSSITFKLRKGIKFHDGTDFNARVVKWNFDQGKTGSMVHIYRYFKSVDVLDDYTIRVYFTEWQNRNVRSFASPACFMMSPIAYEKNGLEWMRWHMVGTGAFKQVEFQKDVILKTVRSDDYWEQGKPYLFGVNLIYVADELTRLALFKSGGGDVLDLAGNYRIASELKSASYPIITKSGGTSFLVPDSKNADSPWSNLKVRQAAEYAIDKDALVKAFGYGFQQSAYQLAAPDSKGYVGAVKDRKYDPEKAKQLLKEAGYPSGFKTKIISGAGGSRDLPVAIQSQLGAVGIQVDLDFAEPARMQTYSSGTWNNALLMGNILYRANFNDALNLWFGVPTVWYQSMKKPDDWEAMFKATMTSPDQNPALMQKCVQALYDDETIIPLSYGTSLWATTDKVHDSGIGQRGTPDHWNLQNAWLSK